MDLLKQPLSPPDAKRLILKALATGDVRFTTHALEEMAKDGIAQHEAITVLRGGVVEPGEFINTTWRYRVRARRAVVVTAFRSESTAVVVTAWRTR
jgi:hypothetical protein